jgi:hypothetical protein
MNVLMTIVKTAFVHIQLLIVMIPMLAPKIAVMLIVDAIILILLAITFLAILLPVMKQVDALILLLTVMIKMIVQLTNVTLILVLAILCP